MLQDLLNEQKSLFAPGVHTELRGQNNRNRRVVLLSGDVLANVRSDVSGVSARVYRNGVWGFSSMAEYTKEAAATVLKAASENAAFMDRHAGNGKPALAPLTGGQPFVMEGFTDPAQKTYVDFAREIDGYIAAHCPQLTSRKVIATEDSMEKLLKVSDGRDAHILSPRSYIYVFLSAEMKMDKAREMVTGKEYYASKEIIRSRLKNDLELLDRQMASTRQDTSARMMQELSAARIVVICLTAVLVFLIWLTARLSTIPLIRASESIRNKQAIPLDGSREFRQLAENYNEMYGSLHHENPETNDPE